MIWRDRLSLSTQFLVAAALVLCASMAVLGTWVNHQITRSVLVTSGAGGSDFMMGFLEAEVQNLLPDGTMPLENQQRLDRLFVGTPVAESIVSIKIWRPDGRVIYSSMSKDVVGKHFVSADVAKAARGQIVAEFEDMVSQESAYEQTLNKSLIEVYAPLYKTGTDIVVAVGEVYEDAEALDAQLNSSQILTWVVVCLTTLLMLAFLYLIVRRGSYTIALQRAELRERIAEAQRMAAQNEQLRLDANEANEELLGRIGSDIHDGPIQVLTLARFRLDEIAGIWSTQTRGEAVGGYLDEARTTVAGSIEELRQLSTGLVLPELNEKSPRDVIELARDRHENMTATQVELDLGELPDQLSEAMKICIYRIVQESLTNAFRHAGGIGQRVEARVVDGCLRLLVSDRGAHFARDVTSRMHHTKLGHRGIRNRVQAFGGTLEIGKTETGTDVRVSLPLDGARASLRYGKGPLSHRLLRR
ncbi:sensor histidine kinase [Aminobacter aganoensis]|uniref:histidine kinase n=1 Tax=Aminobacter aganoensis TaxID=83264 RepID=A0A7X0FC50_9HYPH|nr:ATP-binding protein [Aminobacter aganoensis]MBB6357009.1 signal transduction histidine kinase [Aminobacter aganoensis]